MRFGEPFFFMVNLNGYGIYPKGFSFVGMRKDGSREIVATYEVATTLSAAGNILRLAYTPMPTVRQGKERERRRV